MSVNIVQRILHELFSDPSGKSKKLTGKTDNINEHITNRLTIQRSRNGFLFSEALCAMLAMIIMLTLCYAILDVSRNCLDQPVLSQEAYAILQIRQKTALAHQISVSPDQKEVNLKDGNRTWSLVLEKGRLVKKPGYVIYLDQLETARFLQKEDRIELIIEGAGGQRRWQIA